MGRLREINAKAQFAFSPVSTSVATVTASGTLNDDSSDEPKIEIYDTQLDNTDAEAFTLKTTKSIAISERLAFSFLCCNKQLMMLDVSVLSGAG